MLTNEQTVVTKPSRVFLNKNARLALNNHENDVRHNTMLFFNILVSLFYFFSNFTLIARKCMAVSPDTTFLMMLSIPDDFFCGTNFTF